MSRVKGLKVKDISSETQKHKDGEDSVLVTDSWTIERKLTRLIGSFNNRGSV